MKIHWLTVPAVALALVAAGCGDDKNKNDKNDTGVTTPTTTAKEPVKPAPADAPAGGEQAVKDTILKWTFEGDCDVMTDKFLEAQAFIGDNRKERCDYFEKAFQKPQYTESDVKFRKVAVTGDKATATVGSDLANITTDYQLVSEGGQWKIDDAG
jgi:hypothetical protein